jgi:fatty-acyl-CoA synthase
VSLTQRIRSHGVLARGLLEGTGSNRTLALELERRSAHRSQAARPFLLHADQQFDYEEANRIVNRIAHAYRAAGVRKGDVLALLMENRPEFVWHYLAAGKLGVVVALVNTRARGDGLAHALSACGATHMTVGSECLPAFLAVRDRVADELIGRCLVDEGEIPATRDTAGLERFVPSTTSTDPPETAGHTLGDTGAYVFTSGTTGLPKAAVMSYQRLTTIGRVIGALAWRPERGDVIYNCLPLFHTNALVIALSSVLTHGATLALGRRFSTSAFWREVHRFEATGFNYIGEMCRYLVNTPPGDHDRGHRVRVVVGQGLQADVWTAVQARFAIPRIVEMYASTEGNIATINLSGEVGSVGKLRLGGKLVKWDFEQDDFVREDGRLVRCEPGEIGVLLGPIRKRTPFSGYRDDQATRAKIVTNAFRDGDALYNTGDTFRLDAQNNLFFVDRLGDTFRYKGENVSTTEVQEQLVRCPGIAAASVYGVRVPGREGRAGMAAVVLADGARFDGEALAAHLDAALPSYAQPVFIRVRASLDTTATLKLDKLALQREGFAPKGGEPFYVRDAGESAYQELTPERYSAIVRGEERAVTVEEAPDLMGSPSAAPLVVRKSGIGPSVVLVHGGLPAPMTWARQQELEARWSLIVPNRRGFCPSPAAPWQDFLADADDLAELIAEVPGGVHLVGFSYGGLSACVAAERLPDQLRSLTLIEAPLWHAAEEDESVRELAALSDRFAANADDGQAQDEFFALAGVDPKMFADVDGDVRQAMELARKLRSPREAKPRFEAITEAGVPALVVSGGHHPAFERLSDALAAALDAQRACLPGAGHAVQHAPGFNTMLETFLTAAEQIRSDR